MLAEITALAISTHCFSEHPQGTVCPKKQNTLFKHYVK